MRTERVGDGVCASIAEDGGVAVGNAGFVDLGGETLVFDTHVSLVAFADGWERNVQSLGVAT